MSSNNQELGQDRATRSTEPVDFDFLDQQTFQDLDLQHEVLGLFVAQSRRLVPALGGMTQREQSEAAHLLSGSARGIGAWAAAAAAAAYEAADAAARPARLLELAAAFDEANTAIDLRLDQAGG